jgi:short-subunit dehydrogenase
MKKVVLITGASSGIGKTTAKYLARNGYKVFGTSRDPKKYPQDIDYKLLKLDLAEKASIELCVKTLMKKTSKIDVLINNAGLGITGPVEEVDYTEIEKNFKINCFGAILMSRAIIPYMRECGSGIIINITSIAGSMGLPFRGVYSASKASLIILSEAMRIEVKDFGIKLCTLAPGDFATDISSRRYHSPIIEGSPYERNYRKSLNLINSEASNGKDPIKIAIKIKKIIEKKQINVHYVLGPLIQKSSLFLKGILPNRLFEKLITNHYKL